MSSGDPVAPQVIDSTYPSHPADLAVPGGESTVRRSRSSKIPTFKDILDVNFSRNLDAGLDKEGTSELHATP